MRTKLELIFDTSRTSNNFGCFSVSSTVNTEPGDLFAFNFGILPRQQLLRKDFNECYYFY